MSGKASRGIRFRDQIPPNTSPATAMKTRKRFALHQSIIRSIIASSHRHRAGYRCVKLLVSVRLAGRCAHAGRWWHERASGGLELAFGVDKEVGRTDYPLARAQAFEYLKI